jgi:hypothetical protein
MKNRNLQISSPGKADRKVGMCMSHQYGVMTRIDQNMVLQIVRLVISCFEYQ